MFLLNKKRIIYIFCVMLIFISLFTCTSKAYVKQTADFYVNDSANLLSDETEKYIININKQLYSKTGAQIVVVTVDSLEGKAIEDYATELFRGYGIGDKEKNNGVLLLLALNERQFRIEVGYGLEGCLTDGKTGRIQDQYIIPYLKNNDWDNGVKNGFNAVLDEVKKEYNVEIDSEAAILIENSESHYTNEETVGIILIPVIAFALGNVLKIVREKNIIFIDIVLNIWRRWRLFWWWRRLIWRRSFFWRRWFFRRWRKHKKFLAKRL